MDVAPILIFSLYLCSVLTTYAHDHHIMVPLEYLTGAGLLVTSGLFVYLAWRDRLFR
jgi:hypothetical protein